VTNRQLEVKVNRESAISTKHLSSFLVALALGLIGKPVPTNHVVASICSLFDQRRS
jgi:hypothetical protein